MKIVGGKRACGKTTRLIEQSAKEWIYIVCPTTTQAEFIFQSAKRMNLKIPYPIPVRELPLRSKRIEKVLVDDVEAILFQLIGNRVETMTTGCEMEEL